MDQRGRDSGKAATLPEKNTEVIERQQPFGDLTPIQRGYWLEITNSLPADWFKPEHRTDLGAYCRTLSSIDFLDAQIDEIERSPEPDWGMYMELSKRRESLVRTKLAQATKMRLTHQATVDPEKRKKQRAAKKPWE